LRYYLTWKLKKIPLEIEGGKDKIFSIGIKNNALINIGIENQGLMNLGIVNKGVFNMGIINKKRSVAELVIL